MFLLLAQEAKPSEASSTTCHFWATEPQPCGTGCFSTYYSNVMLRPKADGDEHERGQADRVSFLLQIQLIGIVLARNDSKPRKHLWLFVQLGKHITSGHPYGGASYSRELTSFFGNLAYSSYVSALYS